MLRAFPSTFRSRSCLFTFEVDHSVLDCFRSSSAVRSSAVQLLLGCSFHGCIRQQRHRLHLQTLLGSVRQLQSLHVYTCERSFIPGYPYYESLLVSVTTDTIVRVPQSRSKSSKSFALAVIAKIDCGTTRNEGVFCPQAERGCNRQKTNPRIIIAVFGLPPGLLNLLPQVPQTVLVRLLSICCGRGIRADSRARPSCPPSDSRSVRA